MPDVMGHAKSFFDGQIPDGALNLRRGLVLCRNGSTTPPPHGKFLFSHSKSRL